MEKEYDSFNNSLKYFNDKYNQNFKYNKYSNYKPTKYSNNILCNNYIGDELNNNFDKFSNNYGSFCDKREIFDKINNKKVNNTLKDIYGVISNINEVNKRVKNILSNRPYIYKYKSADYKGKYNSERNKFKRNRSSTEDFISETNNICNELKYKDFNYNCPSTNTYIISPKTTNDCSNTKEFSDINFSNKRRSNPISEYTKFSNITNQKRNIKKNSYNINNYYPGFHSLRKENLNLAYIPIQKNSNINLTPNKYKKKEYGKDYNDEEISYSYSDESNKKNDDDDDISYDINDKDLKSEKDIKDIELKLKNEEEKLKELEEERNKLIKEEKIRSKIIMDKKKSQNKIRKQSLIKEYKKKISLIKQLQDCHINEIIELEKNKKIDEKKLKNAYNNNNDDNINKKLVKIRNNSYKYKSKHNKLKDKGPHDFDQDDYNIRKGNINNNSNLNDIYGFSDIRNNETTNKIKNYINNNNNDNLRNSYKYINSLLEIKNSNNTTNIYTPDLTNILQGESKKHNSPKKLIDIKEKYQRHNSLNMDEDMKELNKYFYNKNDNDHNLNNLHKNYSNIKLDLKNNSNQPNINNKGENYYYDYNSDLRNYENNNKNKKSNNNTKLYKTYISSNIEIPSLIQTRVNKYNHNPSRESSISKRVSAGKMIPFSFHNDLNCKYYTSSNVSRRTSRRNSERKSMNKKELNYKKIFFSNCQS